MRHVSLQNVPPVPLSHDPALKRVLLAGAASPPHVPQLAQAVLRPGQVSSRHSHRDMHEVFFVQAGSGRMTVGGETIGIGPGSVVHVRPGEEHEIVNVEQPERAEEKEREEHWAAYALPPGHRQGDLVLLYFGVTE